MLFNNTLLFIGFKLSNYKKLQTSNDKLNLTHLRTCRINITTCKTWSWAATSQTEGPSSIQPVRRMDLAPMCYTFDHSRWYMPDEWGKCIIITLVCNSLKYIVIVLIIYLVMKWIWNLCFLYNFWVVNGMQKRRRQF